MAEKTSPMLSVVVPLYNEAGGLKEFHESLVGVLKDIPDDCEIIYVDDGSHDATADIVREFHRRDSKVKLLKLSRNFGKENALSAGLAAASGEAIVMLDGDGQHPVELIPDFVRAWQDGHKVVVGVREANQKEGPLKRAGSKAFYATMNRLAHVRLAPNTTDFALIDRSVQQEFLRLTERSRMTRNLINWLGHDRHQVAFTANPRLSGTAAYSYKKLSRLFIDSVISSSTSPLYLMAYIGGIILPLSSILGLFMVGNALLGDPANLHATGSAYLVVLLVFLVSILLLSQGLIGLYLSHIHTETQNRPLYIIDEEGSEGVGKN